MADQLLLDRQFDDNGNPGAGYIASFFLSGTTTPVTVFTDTGVSIPAGVSVTASAAGRFAQTFHPGGAALKCVITTPLGATVETIDPLPATPLSSSAAENVSFSPTVALPFSNVQDAIEGSVAAAATGFNAFGLGITGNSGLLADIDATNIGAGQYRFDATTAGTFPTGTAAANTGTVVIERKTSAAAAMFLYSETANRRYFRRMIGSTWGAWAQELIATAGTAAAGVGGVETTLTNSDAFFPTSGGVAKIAAGTSGHIKVQGLALENVVKGESTVNSTTFVGRTDLAGARHVLVNICLTGASAIGTISVRFSDNAGGSWGSSQTVLTSAPQNAVGWFRISFSNGGFGIRLSTGANNAGTLTVPAGCNGMQFSHSTSNTGFYDFYILGGVA